MDSDDDMIALGVVAWAVDKLAPSMTRPFKSAFGFKGEEPRMVNGRCTKCGSAEVTKDAKTCWNCR